MNLDQFTAYADWVVNEQIPPEFLSGLNLGIIVLPDLMENDDGDSYILGEYVRSEMGKQVILYYGSFRALDDEGGLENWEEEIADTIRHELRHHVEGLAGEEILANQESQEEWDKIVEKKRRKKENKRLSHQKNDVQRRDLWTWLKNLNK